VVGFPVLYGLWTVDYGLWTMDFLLPITSPLLHFSLLTSDSLTSQLLFSMDYGLWTMDF